MQIIKRGGFFQALFNMVGRNFETGVIESRVERIFGRDEEELFDRIRSRFPRFRQNNRQPWRRRG